jgi:hypothetical protein
MLKRIHEQNTYHLTVKQCSEQIQTYTSGKIRKVPVFSTCARFAKEHEPRGELGAELENISSECGSLKRTKADFS